MSGSTTAIERLLDVSNNLWDTMYESGEVPTYAERYWYYLALKDAMDENAKQLDERDRMYKANVEKNGEILRLLEENAKMRKELEQWHRLTAGIELPEYPITEFKPKDLERENAKLRELVRRYAEYTSQDRCKGCMFKSRCNDGEFDECCQLAEIRGLARELGVEVD